MIYYSKLGYVILYGLVWAFSTKKPSGPVAVSVAANNWSPGDKGDDVVRRTVLEVLGNLLG